MKLLLSAFQRPVFYHILCLTDLLHSTFQLLDSYCPVYSIKLLCSASRLSYYISAKFFMKLLHSTSQPPVVMDVMCSVKPLHNVL